MKHNKIVFYILICVIFLNISGYCAAQKPTQIEQKIESRILNKEVSFSVHFPNSYDQSKQSYPVIYLLHGFGGDHTSWIRRCKIDALTDSLLTKNSIGEFIYIMPDAGNSYYINNYDSSIRYEDFFISEFIPYIDSLYRTVKKKECRGIMGISMGGFGAITLAIKNPELFGSVAGLGSAVRTNKLLKELPQESYDRYFGVVYGPHMTSDQRITEHWKANSPFSLIDSASSPKLSSIHWYIDCGMQDFLIMANDTLHNVMMQYKIPHEYHMRPGTHNWSYWYKSTVRALEFFSETMKPNE